MFAVAPSTSKINRKMKTFICITLAVLVGNLTALAAQTGTLEGRVLNANSGKPVSGFKVAIQKLQTETTTDSLGYYRLESLPPDTYRVRFVKSSYGTHTVNQVVVKAGQATTRNVSLTRKNPPDIRSQEGNPSIQMKASRLKAGQRRNRSSRTISPTPRADFNREAYDRIEANPFRRVTGEPLSTFSIDADRAAYANTRRFLNNGELPPKDAVRIEELINYFDYEYPEPSGAHPFSVYTEAAECAWNKDHQLLHIGLQGKSIPQSAIPPSNLVFLIDVSGSMNSPRKLPLLKGSLRMLTKQLRAQDRITVVVYAGSSGVALPATPGDQKETIDQAISELEAGGGTAGSEGIRLAYRKAEAHFIEGGNNRVILATDGDFNIGVTSDGALTRLIEEKRQTGVFLSVLGFGTGNYQSSKMEKLSNKGNGNYSYIDSRLEAKKTLVEEFGGTLNTIAKDVKLQLEFNPAEVKAYRLIGYVNRQLENADFRNDTVDAGELGAGHSVTALYELVPQGASFEQSASNTPELKYQEKRITKEAYQADELASLRLRYKPPEGAKSQLIEASIATEHSANPSASFQWSAAVAMFGMHLRQSPFSGSTDYALIRTMAGEAMGNHSEGYRKGFMKMVDQAERLEQNRY